ncbi:unnamed protein product [Euphydryas editha]|uniref:Uncharacterized protein n=1 Tax=Euphydryas editha TaxID=104508 RepID=A0AAU9TD44_EUPED|nr:unnamed protein product [Euphydryas editha]
MFLSIQRSENVFFAVFRNKRVSNGDYEDALILDEEDQVFIEQDTVEGASEVIIEPAREPDSAQSSSSTSSRETLPSMSTRY